MEKILKLFLIIIILMLFSCPPAIDKSSNNNKGNGDNGVKTTPYDITIIDATADTLPDFYLRGEGIEVDFSINVKNLEKDVITDEEIFYFICVFNEITQNFNTLYENSDFVTGFSDQSGLNKGEERNYNFDNIDISFGGTQGDNYFYALICIEDIDDLIPYDESNMKNNVWLLNNDPITKILVHDTWDTEALAGGVDADNAVQIPTLDKWYTSSIAVEDDSMWYYLEATIDDNYDIYWDDSWEGSGTYTSDVVVYIYHDDKQTLYDGNDSGYEDPTTITADENTIYIEVNAFFNEGSFAIGINQP